MTQIKSDHDCFIVITRWLSLHFHTICFCFTMNLFLFYLPQIDLLHSLLSYEIFIHFPLFELFYSLQPAEYCHLTTTIIMSLLINLISNYSCFTINTKMYYYYNYTYYLLCAVRGSRTPDNNITYLRILYCRAQRLSQGLTNLAGRSQR